MKVYNNVISAFYLMKYNFSVAEIWQNCSQMVAPDDETQDDEYCITTCRL